MNNIVIANRKTPTSKSLEINLETANANVGITKILKNLDADNVSLTSF